MDLNPQQKYLLNLSVSGQCPSFNYMSVFHECLRKDETDILSRWYTCDIQFKIQLSWFQNDYLHFRASDDFEPCEKYHAKLSPRDKGALW